MEPLRIVQQHLGVPQTGKWDDVTGGAILAYQHTHHTYDMSPDGHVDPATLANLGYYDPGNIFTDEWEAAVASGERPSTFSRDLETAIDQVPRWAWGTTAVLFGLFAYLSYRGERKKP
jgi:hypothetical protein